MNAEARMWALDQLCSAIVNQGDVVSALVTLIEPNAPPDQFLYRLMVEHAERFRFEIGTADSPAPSQFKVVIQTSLPVSFQVTLPFFFRSTGDMLRFSEQAGRDFTDLSRVRLVLGMVFHMLIARQPALLQALRTAFGFLPRQVEFFVSTEDYCGDPGTLSLSRLKGQANVLLPDPYYFGSNAYDEHKQLVIAAGRPWAARSDIILWRGSTTGRVVTARNLFENRRIALAAYCADDPDIFDVKLTNIGQMSDADIEEARQILTARNLVADWMDVRRFAEHKFALHIDGNASAAGFFEKLSLGCCVLQVESDFEQWYEPRLEPWVHYVQIAKDFADLKEKARFLLGNPSLAEKIAKAGFEFALEADQHHEAGWIIRQLAASLNLRRINLTLTAPSAEIAALQGESLEEIWHGLEEGSNEQLFRWTRSREVTWPLNLEASANALLNLTVSLAGPIGPPFADGCKIRLGGREFPLINTGWELKAEIPLERGGLIRDVTLVTPPLFSPSDDNVSEDRRQLGLPVRAG